MNTAFGPASGKVGQDRYCVRLVLHGPQPGCWVQKHDPVTGWHDLAFYADPHEARITVAVMNAQPEAPGDPRPAAARTGRLDPDDAALAY